jgi:hypothetical protein
MVDVKIQHADEEWSFEEREKEERKKGGVE